MAKEVFKSSLSEKEIMDNFENVDFFSGVVAGLEEAVAYEKGSARAATFARKRSLPEVNVVQIRKSLNMTQKEFSVLLGVSPRTVEAWESGKSTPTPTAKNLMFLISEDHSLVSKLQRSA